MGAFGEERPCGVGRMGAPLPADETSMSGDVGGAPTLTGGTGAPEAWLPRCQMGRGSGEWILRSLETEAWAGRNWGGAAAGGWGPHQRGLGEPVTVSGLWVQTHLL